MIIGRREWLIGATCALAAGGAAAMRPRHRLSLLGDAKLEALVPLAFGDWRGQTSDTLVQPDDEDSLAAKLYSEIVGRIYVNDAGGAVMLLIAYGDTQNDLLQLHRPEVCYPAFGMEITSNQRIDTPLAGARAQLPSRILTATGPDRTEHVLYWTRIGEHLPVDGREQRVAKLKDQVAGIIPDGVLVRVSNLVSDARNAAALNMAFVATLVSAMAPATRRSLVGSQIAQAMSGATRPA